MFYFLIIFSKIVSFFSHLLKVGSGSTWPGHIALYFDSKFVRKILQKNPHLKVVIITGTNGKTTTAALLKYLLEKNNISCFSNQEGANLLNGVASALVKNANFSGKITKQIAIFEVDEFNFPLILEEVNPLAIVILNLFRDQLDRYGEVNTIASRWLLGLKKVSAATTVFLNGDDPQLYYLGKNIKANVFYFGLDERYMFLKKLSHDVDFNYCPVCFNLLSYKKVSYSHLGSFFCSRCGFHRSNILTLSVKNIHFPLYGLYNQYNLTAVFLLLNRVFNLELTKLTGWLRNFSPAFGRQEDIFYKDRHFYLLLSKNPTGFNQSIEAMLEWAKNKKYVLWIILNNEIPDGRDVSWIWDVDLKKMFIAAKKIYVSGNRAYDMAIRLKYENIRFRKNILPEIDLKKTLNHLKLKTKANEEIFVFANYSAMLEIRKILLGKKFL